MTTRNSKIMVSLALAALLSVSLCGCGAEKIEEGDLLGTWFANLEPSEYKTITFNDDGSYRTEDFLSEGEFQIARDGTVKLVNAYNEVTTILVDKENGQWVLEYEQPYVPIIFTREPREKPDNVQVGQSANAPAPSEMQLMYMAAIDQILIGSAWTIANGTPVVFSGEDFTIEGEDPVEYVFRTGEGVDGGYIFTLENPQGTYVGQISERLDGEALTGYSLVLKLNGEAILSASCNGAVELSQP